jgi:ferritin
MLTDDLRKLLIQQIGSELAAHQLYMGIAIWFDRQSLKRWAKLFQHQSVEEAQHATKIMDFLTDNEIEFDLPALKAVTTRFASASAAVRTALESERAVALQFDRMAAVAVDKGDHRGHQFLQWFIEEQVEEEAKIQRLLDLVDSGINLYQAEAVLDTYE